MPSEQQQELTVYGIKNCDTCRRAQAWLDARKVSFTFHDFRTDGLTESMVHDWMASEQASGLINRRSTTWRKLTEAEKQASESNPVPLLLAHPTLIKRPVFTRGHSVLAIGFSPDQLENCL